MDLLHRETVFPSKALDLVQGYRMHPAGGGGRTASQIDGEQPTGFDQPGDFPEGPLTMRWRDVLPDRGHYDEIEVDPQWTERTQFRKLIIYPTDTRVRM
jgi:hypothetical protein